MTAARDLAACPVCGGVTLQVQAATSPLLAVSDYLVERVLLKVGVLLTRGTGSRVERGAAASAARAAGLEAEQCWRVFATPGDVVDKAIETEGGWRVVGLMLGGHGELSARQVQAALTDYVHELVADRIPHTRTALRRRLHDGLGVELHDDALERISA